MTTCIYRSTSYAPSHAILKHLRRSISRQSRAFTSTSHQQHPASTPRQQEQHPPVSPPSSPNNHNATVSNPTPRKGPSVPLTAAQKAYLDSALRVNQAGELAATLIYTAQTPPIVRAHPHLRPLMQHMYDQESHHHATFNSLLAKHRVRPTLLNPIWTLAASALGWSTAVLGREAAMACTEAVETEIGTHYNNQVRVLLGWVAEMEKRGEDVGADIKELVGTIKQFRDEELEHLDHAVEEDARQARPYELLTGVIRAGCRGAIWASERV